MPGSHKHPTKDSSAFVWVISRLTKANLFLASLNKQTHVPGPSQSAHNTWTWLVHQQQSFAAVSNLSSFLLAADSNTEGPEMCSRVPTWLANSARRERGSEDGRLVTRTSHPQWTTLRGPGIPAEGCMGCMRACLPLSLPYSSCYMCATRGRPPMSLQMLHAAYCSAGHQQMVPAAACWGAVLAHDVVMTAPLTDRGKVGM